jgi:hypothetical protein
LTVDRVKLRANEIKPRLRKLKQDALRIEPRFVQRINEIGTALLEYKNEILDQKQFLMEFLNEFYYAIAPGKHLISMTCWVAGYWTTTANYIYDETENPPQVKQLSVPIYDSDTAQLIPSLVSRGFQRYQEETHTLTVGRKYSGAGNCGFRATYLLKNEEFILTQFREHKKCNDGAINHPGKFPQVYP